MTPIIQYSCAYENLFAVEAAFAAAGYQLEVPWQRSVGGGEAAVMMDGRTMILLSYRRDDSLAEIEISGESCTMAVNLIESLPVPLQRCRSES